MALTTTQPSVTSSPQVPLPPLMFFGGGAMGEAMVRGGLDAGVLSPEKLLVVDPVAERRAVFAGLGVRTVAHAHDALRDSFLDDSTQFVLAIKPQSFPMLAAELSECTVASSRTLRIVISIIAGTPSARIAASFNVPVAVIRAMPNTPATIRLATTGLALGHGARPGDESVALRLFSAIGHVEVIPESLFDAFTAVGGSGPAYIFLLAEAMAAGARDAGFDPALADRVSRATIRGAAELLARSPDSPEALRARVTSKGGTTAAAMGVLDQGEWRQTLARAIVAARDRGRDLASENP